MNTQEDWGRCVLVDATPADTERLCVLPAVEVVPAAELEERLSGGEGRVDLVVVGSGAASPVSLVQRAHRAVPDAGVAVLATDTADVHRRVSFAPGVPLDLLVAAADDGDLLDRLRALRLAAAGRRRHAAVMAAVVRSAAQAAGSAPAGVTAVGALLEHAPIAVLVVDPSGELLGWNRRAEVMLDLQPSINGQSVDAVIPGALSIMVPVDFSAGKIPHASAAPLQVALAGRAVEISAVSTQTDQGRPVVLLLAVDVTAQREAERERERLAGHVQLLARVSESLMASLDVPGSLVSLSRVLVPALADWVSIHVLTVHNQVQNVVIDHRDPALAPVARAVEQLQLRRSIFTEPSLRAAAGERVLLPLVDARELADQVFDAELRSLVRQLGMGSALAVPLPGRDGVLGSLLLVNAPGSRSFDDTEMALAVEVGRRAGIALDRARLGTAQAQLAEGLQRSLLTDPPQPNHAQIVVRYVPAAEAARVGGDWYDAFVQPGGTTMLVIGDVAGHDTAAAATMGQLRGLLRGIATYSDARPAEVLRGLDASMDSLQLGALATAAVVRFEQTPEQRQEGRTRMVWASAGHPPPLILHSDGSVTVPADWQGDLLLGVDPGAGRRERVITLDRDATVLMYTDGLIERRDAPLDDGLDRLVHAVTDLADAGLDELCDGVLDRMVRGRPDDDVALVAVRLHRQDRPRPADAGANSIPPSGPFPPRLAQ